MRLLIIISIFFTGIIYSQTNSKEVFYEGNRIAIKKSEDIVNFYNYYGRLKKQIDLNKRRLTYYSNLPFEIENIIYDGIPERIEIDYRNLPISLYKEKSYDAGIVFCDKSNLYNDLGLKIKQTEVCPDDTGGDDYIFEKEFSYNKYGELLTIDGDTINGYNDRGQLVTKYGKNNITKAKLKVIEYIYKDSLLLKSYRYYYNSLEKIKSREVREFTYDCKGKLIKIVGLKEDKIDKTPQYDIIFSYNEQNQLIKVTKKNIHFNSQYNVLVYDYDSNSKLTNIKIYYNNSNYYKDYHFTYNSKGDIDEIFKK